MPHEHAESEEEGAVTRLDATRIPAQPNQDVRSTASAEAQAVLKLQRAVGNAATARLVAKRRGASATRPHPSPPKSSGAGTGRPPAETRNATRHLQRETYPVIPAMEAEDKTRQWFDPADKKAKPVWTSEGGYVKNPSARELKDIVKPNGRIGGGFDNGTYTYVVNDKGDVVIAKRLGEPGGRPGRATGMPHPTLIGGKAPTVQAAGEVEIRGGRIFRIDNQSGHFRAPRKSMSITVKSFLRLPATAFDPTFKAQSVHYDQAGNRTTKPFRTLRTLKLKGRDFKRALRGLKPRAIAGRLKGQKFRSGAKSAGAGIAGLLVYLALNYFLGKLMEKITNDLIESQINNLAPKVEQQLAERQDELEALLEADSEADVHINVRFRIARIITHDYDPHGAGEIESMPVVELHSVGFSREAWDPKPIHEQEMYCGGRSESTIVTASQAINPTEVFADDGQPADTAAAQ